MVRAVVKVVEDVEEEVVLEDKVAAGVEITDKEQIMEIIMVDRGTKEMVKMVDKLGGMDKADKMAEMVSLMENRNMKENEEI